MLRERVSLQFSFRNHIGAQIVKEALAFSTVWRLGAAANKQHRRNSTRQGQCSADKHNVPKTCHERRIYRLFQNLAHRRTDLLRNFLGRQIDSLIVKRMSRRRGQLEVRKTRIERSIEDIKHYDAKH